MIKTPKLRFKEFSGDWETHLLGKSITLYDNERKPVKEQERNSGEYAYYGATGIIDHIDNYIFEGEYLLLGEDGANIVTRNAPLIYKTEGKFWVNNHAHIFKPKTQFDIDFMKQRLELINYIPYNTGTAQPKLNADSIKSIPFNAPSKEEQEKIASFFSLIDNKISLQGEKVEALKDYKKGMMQKIFSRELRFKDDDGRDYPEWEEKKIGNIAECLDNKRKPLNSTQRGEMQGDIPYYGANGIVDFVNDYIFDEEIILLAEDGGNFEEFATRPIAQLVTGKSWVNNHAHVLKSKHNTEFLFYSLVHKDIRKYINGTSRAKLNKSDMLDIVVNIPKSLEEQKKIANVLGSIYLKIEKEQKKLDSLNEYKKGLLQQMFV